jgi:hypothetical protein
MFMFMSQSKMMYFRRVFLIEGEGGMSQCECKLQIDEGYSVWCDSNASAVGIVKFDSGASQNLT